MITYSDSRQIDPKTAIDLYVRSTLGERRPVDNPDTFGDMFKHANLIISAWHGDKLVGVARSFTDFTYATYLADLAVDESYQRQGIGKQLIEEIKSRIGPNCMIVLLAAPKAQAYYEPLGFKPNPRAWTYKGPT